MLCFKIALKSFVTRLEFKVVFQLSKTFNKFFKLNKWSKAIATRNSCGFTSTKELKEINESLKRLTNPCFLISILFMKVQKVS